MLPDSPDTDDGRSSRPGRLRPHRRSVHSKFEVGWRDWAVAVALGAIAVLLAALALEIWGGWSHQRDVARAMEEPPPSAPVPATALTPTPREAAPGRAVQEKGRTPAARAGKDNDRR